LKLKNPAIQTRNPKYPIGLGEPVSVASIWVRQARPIESSVISGLKCRDSSKMMQGLVQFKISDADAQTGGQNTLVTLRVNRPHFDISAKF